MTTHELKTKREFYDRVASGIKTFEVRYNDRGFATNDILRLIAEPYDAQLPVLEVIVMYVLRDFYGLKEGFVAMGIAPYDRLAPDEFTVGGAGGWACDDCLAGDVDLKHHQHAGFKPKGAE